MPPALSMPSVDGHPDDPLAKLNELHGSTTEDQLPYPIEISKVLVPRSESTSKSHPGQGAIDPSSINMKGLMALFAIICAAFVIAAIWFFFWAKNGGFVWRKGDWDEYKSTVLRRKDANGRTLTNATKSTDLGGGSIVGRGYSDYYNDGTTTMDTETVATSEKPRRKGFRETAKEKFLRKQKQETWEGGHDDDMRAYRHEKPARVGGMNREAEGTYHGSDYTTTNEDRSEWTQSEAGYTAAYTEQTYEERRPARTRNISDYSFTPGSEEAYEASRPARNRDVSGYSFTPGTEDTISYTTEEQQPLRESSPRRPHPTTQSNRHNRTSQRPRGPRATAAHSRQSSPRKRERTSMPGGFAEPLDISSVGASEYRYEHVEGDDTGSGTISYHHPIPALSKGYRRSGGMGRKRRDSLSDSEGDDYDSRLS